MLKRSGKVVLVMLTDKEALEYVAIEMNHQVVKGFTAKHDSDHNEHDWIAICMRELSQAAFCDTRGKFARAMLKVAAVAVTAVVWASK